jgi:hypothetical protein
MILTQALAPRAIVRLSVFPAGRFSTNPSILRLDGGALCLVKGVNFDFERIWLSSDWQALDPNEPIACVYNVVHLDDSLRQTACFALDTSAVESVCGKPVGVEDLRLFWLDGAITVCGCVVDRNFVWTGARWIAGAPTSRIFVAELVLDRLERVRVLDSPVDAVQEKNWAPVSGATDLALLVDVARGGALAYTTDDPPVLLRAAPGESLRWSGGWSGSSCLMPWGEGHIGVIHRRSRDAPPVYWHMFALFDKSLHLLRRSDPFSFEGRPVEFCCGLDVGADSVTVSYGVMDKAAALAVFAREDIARMIRHDVADGDLQRLAPVSQMTPSERALRALALEQERASLLQGLYDQTLRARELEARLAHDDSSASASRKTQSPD